MANEYAVNKSDLTTVANAIRTKAGLSGSLVFPDGFASAISNLPTPRSKIYEITLAKASGWVLLTTLDSEVLSHINDASFRVSLFLIDDYSYVNYRATHATCSNGQLGDQNSYPVYGVIVRNTGETTIQFQFVYYPANKTDTATSLGGAQFRISGSKYYFRPSDGFLGAGTYRLTFTW